MSRATRRKFTVQVPWSAEVRGGNRLADLVAAVDNARLHGVPDSAQVFAKNALFGGAMLRLTFTWQEIAS